MTNRIDLYMISDKWFQIILISKIPGVHMFIRILGISCLCHSIDLIELFYWLIMFFAQYQQNAQPKIIVRKSNILG